MEAKARLCLGCNLSVEPIYIYDRSPKTKKPYLIVRCPRERCSFNIDIEDYVGQRPKRVANKPEKSKEIGGDGGESFWRYDL